MRENALLLFIPANLAKFLPCAAATTQKAAQTPQ
jgi:hypothetical protein